jgi:hypothetical protein
VFQEVGDAGPAGRILAAACRDIGVLRDDRGAALLDEGDAQAVRQGAQRGAEQRAVCDGSLAGGLGARLGRQGAGGGRAGGGLEGRTTGEGGQASKVAPGRGSAKPCAGIEE